MDQELKLFGLLLMWLCGMCTGYFTGYSLRRTSENTSPAEHRFSEHPSRSGPSRLSALLR